MSAAARVQRRLWGTDPRAWAELAEAHNRAAVRGGARRRAASARARSCSTSAAAPAWRWCSPLSAARVPSGIDISPGLLGVARERLPDADLREGDMEELPFADAAFDAVIGINAFQFAGDPRARAARGGARAAPGGRLVASLFAAPERSQGTVVHEAMAR